MSTMDLREAVRTIRGPFPCGGVDDGPLRGFELESDACGCGTHYFSFVVDWAMCLAHPEVLEWSIEAAARQLSRHVADCDRRS